MGFSDHGCKLVVMRESRHVTLNEEPPRRRLPYRGTSEVGVITVGGYVSRAVSLGIGGGLPGC